MSWVRFECRLASDPKSEHFDCHQMQFPPLTRKAVSLVPARVLLGKQAIIVGKPLNILTVDDEFRVAHALAFALSDPARKLTLAFSTDEALAKLNNHPEPFDMVIIDHKMPKVSGIELVQRLRAVQFGGKIIVLSAHLTDENRRAYAELHVDTMLTKPFDVHELRQVVDSLAHAA